MKGGILVQTTLTFSTALPIGLEVWTENAFSHDDHRQLAQFGNILGTLSSPQLIVEIFNRLLAEQQKAWAEEAIAHQGQEPPKRPPVFRYDQDTRRVVFLLHARFALKMFNRILVNPFKNDPPFFNQYGRLVMSQRDYQGRQLNAFR